MIYLCPPCFEASGVLESLTIGTIAPQNCYGCGCKTHGRLCRPLRELPMRNKLALLRHQRDAAVSSVKVLH